jgi:uncharacterized membrane protein HdeD (DUF308 family)
MMRAVLVEVTPEMIQHWGWFLAYGIVLLLLGILAIVRSVASTVVSTVFLGWLLLFAGVFEFATAFMVGNWVGFLVHLLVAIVFVAAGAVMAFRPVISAETITYVMAMFFLIAGIFQVVSAIWTHLPGWGWQALDGTVASALGFLLLAQWPVSGLYAIGLFVGIDLVLHGSAWTALAISLHRM